MRKRILQLKSIKGQVTIDGVTFQHPTDKKNIQYVLLVVYMPNDDNTIDYVLGKETKNELELGWKMWEKQ